MEKFLQSKTKKRNRLFKIIVIIFTVLLTIRLILPYIVLKYVNKSLSEMEEYYGHVNDIDISLIRGAYVIKEMNLLKKVSEKNQDKFDTIPFFYSKNIDLSIEWRALFKGKIVGEIVLNEASVNFVKGKVEQGDIETDTADFRKLVKDLMPLSINNFEVNHSEIHYIDPYTNPRVDIFMNEIKVRAKNLTNVNKSDEILPSTVVSSANIYGGTFKMDIQLDALADVPTFDMNTKLEKLDITKLNDFFQAYGNFDAEKGEFSMYLEIAAKNGEIGGYVKPLMKDLDIVKWKKEEGNFRQILWESVVGASAEIFENQRNDQFATKVEMRGEIENPKFNILSTISYTLRNAFFRALKPNVDNTIDINNLEEVNDTLLEKIFNGKKKKNEK